MDFQCRVEALSNFLCKCKLDPLVTDLILQGNEQGLFAKFTDQHSSMYCEVFEPSVKITKPGTINIPSIKQLLNSLSRIESEIIRVVSDDSRFVLTDGASVGKSKINLTQVDRESINSNTPIEGKLGMFDRTNLSYVNGKFTFTEGFEIDIGILQTVLKDAKAFDVERYNFVEEDGILSCKIENVTIGNFFNRKLPTISKIGSVPIKSVIVGVGFRDIINAIASDSVIKKIKLYINEFVILLTDGSNFFYCLHTVENK